MSFRAELGRRVVERATLHGEFRLRSGAVSNVYFDKYLLESDPALLRDIVEAMAPMVPEEIDVLAGLEMGGIPLVTMLSQCTGLPALFVRKEAKQYGTCNLAEGGEVGGRRLLLVEDIITSGGAVLSATHALREHGALVGPVLCVIDRESGGLEALAEAGLTLYSLFRRSEFEEFSGSS